MPAIIVEKNPRPGDSWRNRYKSLCLHDPVWYDHLPYLPFPDDWPVFSPKDKIGDWLESYTKLMELNYWPSTECKSARWDDAQQEWQVTVEHKGESVTLRPKHLVFATGMSAVPNLPSYPGIEQLQRHPGAQQQLQERRSLARQDRRWWSAPTTRRTTSAPTCGSTAPTSRWCSARPRTWRAATR